jgi:hypothetical protein
MFFLFAVFLVAMMDDTRATTDKHSKRLTESLPIQSVKYQDMSNEMK